MNLRHVKETIREKMRLEAPALFAQLQAAGTLEATLAELTEDVQADVVNASVKAGADPKLGSPQKHMERVQTMEDAARRTLETLLSNLEFPGVEPTTTDSGMRI
jgi:hypothetical protein